MFVKRAGDTMIISNRILCTNYTDITHIDRGFEKISQNEYKCIACETIMVVKEPTLSFDIQGNLRMQVITEPKK